MNVTIAYGLVGLFALSCIVGVAALLVAVVCMLRLPFNVKPDAFSDGLPLNPLNVIFATEKLSESGLVLRRRLGHGLVVFFSALVVGIGAGVIVLLIR